MRKTLLAFTILSLMLLAVGTIAQAAQSENITITMKVTPGLSVELSGNTIALGSVDPGSTTESNATTVKNNGSGVAEKFTLSHSYSGDWTSGTTPGKDTFVLNAAFAADVANATWAHVDSAASGSVAYDGTEKLWFQFKAPASTATAAQQSITVTVTAQLP